jgi:5'-AMP-activated protein kinase catalytic alpha subunit
MKRFVKQFIEPLTDIAQIDEEILQEVIKMGFDRNQLIESLRNRMQNEVWSF